MKPKYALLIMIALMGSMALSSCKKDWTCTCSTSGQTVNHEIDDETLLNAKSKCDSYQGFRAGGNHILYA